MLDNIFLYVLLASITINILYFLSIKKTRLITFYSLDSFAVLDKTNRYSFFSYLFHQSITYSISRQSLAADASGSQPSCDCNVHFVVVHLCKLNSTNKTGNEFADIICAVSLLVLTTRSKIQNGVLCLMQRCWLLMRPIRIRWARGGWRCPWCNGYRRRKWTRRHELKSWTRLIAIHIALKPLGKV